jgi:alpha-tubulin suppressor-like RCC1 family protein
MFADLPDANTVPNGHVAYLDDVKVPVITSNCSWIGLDGRTVGTFVENQLFAWGLNVNGAFGNGTLSGSCSPVREICNATDWCQVSGGCSHTLAVKTSGQLWAWGVETCGVLGDGTTTRKCSPVREFCSATNWCQVSSGLRHAAALKVTGEIWTWGHNFCGNLGDGTTTFKCSPIREICSDTNWCQVSASSSTVMAIKSSGELWGWGGGTTGNIGWGGGGHRCSPVREFCSATDWCQVGAGYTHTLAVKTSGQLWSWGSSACGEIGDGFKFTRNSPVREICSATDWCQASASYRRSAAIKTSGELWAWGCNTDGLLGDGTTTSRCSPVREFCSATDWCQVSAGRCHSLALKTSGELWAWGVNTCGPLGNGILSVAASCSPIREFYSATDWCYVNAGCIFSLAINAKTVVCR